MTAMMRIPLVLSLGVVLAATAVVIACGGGGSPEKPGERVTDPARVPSSTAISGPNQNPTLYQIKGNEVIISGGASGEITPVVATTPVVAEYVVKAGDLCGAIASNNKISLAELQKANRNVDCDALKVGDKLKIPSGAAAATPTRGIITGNPTVKPSTGGGTSYTVAAGDTCSGIASSNGVTLAAFLAANGSIDADCSNLDVGDTVTIP